jgi:hypothetical protein
MDENLPVPVEHGEHELGSPGLSLERVELVTAQHGARHNGETPVMTHAGVQIPNPRGTGTESPVPPQEASLRSLWRMPGTEEEKSPKGPTDSRASHCLGGPFPYPQSSLSQRGRGRSLTSSPRDSFLAALTRRASRSQNGFHSCLVGNPGNPPLSLTRGARSFFRLE